MTCIYASSQALPKSKFRLEVFSPVSSSTFPTKRDDNWLGWGPVYKYTSKSSAMGYSVSYLRRIKGILLGYRLGWVNRYMKETNYFQFNGSRTVNETMNSRQEDIWNSILLTYEERYKNFSFKLGGELPFIHYGRQKYEYTSSTTDYLADKTLSYENRYRETQDIAPGYATGAGMNIGVAYHFSGIGYRSRERVAIGVDLCNYLLYTKFVKTNTRSYTSYQYINDGNNASSSNTGASIEQPSNTSKLGFSKLSAKFYVEFAF